MPQFIPEIAQAYQNDPRSKLAQALVQQGGNTGPVAGGGWAWADGIARALAGAAGGYVQHKQEAKYDKQQQELTDKVAAALGGGAATPGTGGGTAVPPQGVQQPGGVASAAQGQPPVPAMVPPPENNPPAPPQAPPPQMPPQAAPGPQGAPQAAPGPQPDPLAALPPQGAPQQPPVAPAIAAALAGGGSGTAAAPFAAPNGMALVNAMIPITALTESTGRDFSAAGKAVTSPKGAKYKMQVMPATARNPGFGIKPAASDTPEEYNRVGTELLGKLTEKYGDPAKAWAAYNAGSGRVNHAIAKHGDNWLSALPSETQKYVAKNMAALGGDAPQDATPGNAREVQMLQPTGPTQYQTPEPELPGIPDRPQDRAAAQSLRMGAGQKLLATRDPALFERAMSMIDTGMGEQFNADREALANANDLDKTGYTAGLNDAYNARSTKRTAAYDTRAREQGENYNYGREIRGYAHDNNTREDTQQFTHDERLGSQSFEAGQNALNREATAANTRAVIEGKHEDEETKKQARMQNWLNTPQGSRAYKDATGVMQTNDAVVNAVDNFMALNEKHQNTGGMMMNLPTGIGEWTARNMSPDTQDMDSITRDLAPRMRQAGQGSMSDKDLEGFVKSIPNIRMTYQANKLRAEQFRKYAARVSDYQLHSLQAQADGKQVDFLKQWQTYKNRVPVQSGISFDDWINQNSYGSDGKRK